MSSYAIEAKNISKKYRLFPKKRDAVRGGIKEKDAVSHVSFHVHEGEIYGLLGANGAGKTTTLRILSSLIKPDKGEAFIKDISVIKHSREAKKLLGFMTSDLRLEESFSPDYLFDLFCALREAPIQERDRRKKMLFSRFGIDEFAHKNVGDLSTGMRQKAALAIALAHNPSVVILDEPTNGLDIAGVRTVTELLLDMKAEGKAVLLSTHDLSLVRHACDRIGMMVDGRMLADEPSSVFAEEGALERMFFTLYDTHAKERGSA